MIFPCLGNLESFRSSVFSVLLLRRLLQTSERHLTIDNRIGDRKRRSAIPFRRMVVGSPWFYLMVLIDPSVVEAPFQLLLLEVFPNPNSCLLCVSGFVNAICFILPERKAFL